MTPEKENIPPTQPWRGGRSPSCGPKGWVVLLKRRGSPEDFPRGKRGEDRTIMIAEKKNVEVWRESAGAAL